MPVLGIIDEQVYGVADDDRLGYPVDAGQHLLDSPRFGRNDGQHALGETRPQALGPITNQKPALMK